FAQGSIVGSRRGFAGLICGVIFAVPVPGFGVENLVRNGGFEDAAPVIWQVPDSGGVEVSVVAVGGATGSKALKVEWTDVKAFTKWAKSGGLLKIGDAALRESLQRDRRYRVRCRVKVERFEVPDSALDYLEEGTPPGQFDAPTVTVGCRGGAWNSGMAWAAYDISRLGQWQELEWDFVTPFTSAGSFLLGFDAYPHFRPPMQSSGAFYLDDLVVEAVPPRVGFTRAVAPIEIDGDLGDWWQTNPVVITRDMLVSGEPGANRDASGLAYTMWDDERIYVAAKVIDDEVGRGDALVIRLDGRDWVISGTGDSGDGAETAVRSVDELGSTTNIYRIASQYGDAVDGRAGYVVEAAIPYRGKRPKSVAFEIRDHDGGDEEMRVLRYPAVRADQEWAEASFANERGELRGGDYPRYAITDAANARSAAMPLSVKNVSSHVSAQGRLGYPIANFRRGSTGKVDAVISWTTDMPASGFVEFGDDRKYGMRVDG
ncbi:MAG: sugar-binding protein, partial [Verrucomicrobiales bacterium]